MSLSARILWLVLAASLLPVPALVWLLLEFRSATTTQARDRLVARASIIASDLDDKIAGTGQLLFGLARVPLLAAGDKEMLEDLVLAGVKQAIEDGRTVAAEEMKKATGGMSLPGLM